MKMSDEDSTEDLTADFSRVPVVDVHRDNLDTHLPHILHNIQQSSFVAIDCELSGLGNRKKLNASSIDERYLNTSLVAKTRSVIALGISTFQLENIQETSGPPEHQISQDCEKSDTTGDADESGKSWNYRVNTYNILALCGEDYIVEPGALKFLVERGFDFNTQYSLGIQYMRGNDREEDGTKDPLRDIFSHLVKSRKALVLHNGLIDLMFLYHNFYAALPDKLGTFMSDVCEMFPSGVYDTKYIADYVSRTQASFLEFVFRKEQKINREKYLKNRPHVKLRFQVKGFKNVDWRHCGGEKEVGDGVEVCFSYAHHGHCPLGNNCAKSHDIDHIIRHRNTEKDKKHRKRKRPCGENGEDPAAAAVANDNPEDPADQEEAQDGQNGEANGSGEEVLPDNSGGHSAGFDAFMTGFALSTFLVHQTQIPLHPEDFSPAVIHTETLVNKIYLVSKNFPMLLAKSSFSKSSLEHYNKMKKLNLIQTTT